MTRTEVLAQVILEELFRYREWFDDPSMTLTGIQVTVKCSAGPPLGVRSVIVTPELRREGGFPSATSSA